MHWKNKDAENYANKLIKNLGKPDEATKTHYIWHKKAGFDKIVIRDENILHTFPIRHKDFVYSTKKIKVPSNLYSVFAEITGSIIIDGLKQEVTARCGHLIKNAVTLGFVEDVVKGKISSNPKQAKKEYGIRIVTDTIPAWYKDSLKEKMPKEKAIEMKKMFIVKMGKK